MAASFKDKVAIVTGGNSGIGLATVQTFLALGAQVASLDISTAGPAQDNLLSITCDVTSETSVNDAVKAVADKFNHIDILVNCAGVMDAFETPADCTTASWNKVLNINLHGPFFATRAVIPYLLQNNPTVPPNAPPSFSRLGQPLPPANASKGSIINICSIASLGGGSAGTPYTVSKHALLGLTRSTAHMHRDDGIRCNAVMPGGTATNIVANSHVQLDPEGQGFKRTRDYAAVAPDLIRTPEVVSSAVVWLAGAEHVTGAEVVVDGGWRVA